MDTPSATPSSQRLNKYLALCLGISRRQADNLIEQGTISVNDAPAQLGMHISSTDVVKSRDHVVTPRRVTYLILHKPTNYVCSRKQQGNTPTIYSLLPPEFHHLKPVGRLDKDSSGLLIMTNDGDFAFRMTHPSFKKQKRYFVALDQPLQPLHQQMISDFGVMLEDGGSRFMIEKVAQHETASPSYIITMSEGRNRQIRRTFSALGYTVTKLHRTHFGNYSLGDIQRGSWKIIDIS